VSTKAQDLIKQLLERVPSKRISLDDVSSHPWMLEHASAFLGKQPTRIHRMMLQDH
jgi:serine/threonine protein kinase